MIPNIRDTVEWDDIYRAFIVALRNRRIIENFETSFASYVGSEYGVTFSHGRIGLLALLNFYKRKTGKREVIIPAYTCIVVPNVIIQAGLKPVFVDIELETYGPDSTQMLNKISNNTLAVIPTHMFGQVCDIEPIVEGAKDRQIIVIEDSALALGAKRNGLKAGSFGDASFFSLNITKNINTYDGGVVTTNNRELYRFLKSFQFSLKQINIFYQLIKVLILKSLYSVAVNEAVYGTLIFPAFSRWRNLYNLIFNWNINKIEEYMPRPLGEYKSALGLLQLSKLDELNNHRREIANKYNSQLKKEPWLVLPKEKEGNFHVYTEYAVLVKSYIDADSFLAYLISRGVRGTRLFSYCCPSTPALKQLCKSDFNFPNSSFVATNVVTLPNYPFMDDQKISYIADAVSSFRIQKKELQ
jgi:dTDP-4-amino-4,6-dideoxygalactose transaminase